MTLDGRQITYIMTYMGPDQPLFMYFNRLDWHNPNFQKQKKRFRYTTRNRKLRQHQKPRGISICAGKQIR